jgi:hypothetical protein
MIGVVRKDRCCPEQLFGKHPANEEVGPGRRTERQEQVRRLSFVVGMAIGGADDEASLAGASVSPLL